MAQVVKALGVTEAAALLVVPRTWLDDNVRRVTFIQVCVAGGASILDVGVVSPVRVAIVVWFHLPVAVDWKIVVNHVVRVTKGNVSWVEVSEPPEADNRPLKLLGTASLGESKVLRVAEESGRDERVNVLEVKRLLQALLNRVLYPGV
ncbi:uncharacterized protein UV8b_04310 [Ustilaginoidea virens]|uniref:Uncharacterized protein n=1 Tax=Ustilaginoidea virens TaxID=1159556 RepID=A0A8E5HRZ2_USTVR|nr:uncharacterized protein UV8b_04310 [Ustilaginoidea virens]QUC20069.1 hypothetical protein UV8b_04310 [Ustilaginoidea virens]